MNKRNNDVVILPSAKNDYEAPLVLNYAGIRNAAFVLRAANHPLRKKMMELLEENGTMSFNDFQEQLDAAESVIAFHLTKLRNAKIIYSEPIGEVVKYFLDEQRMDKISFLIHELAKDVDLD